MAYISELPLEALGRIFQFYIASCEKPYEWLKLMLVCSYWREVITQTPILWSVIDVNTVLNTRDPEARMKEILQRSGEAGLRISANFRGVLPCEDRMLALILAELWHTSDLEISAPYDHFRAFSAAAQHSAPMIEVLHLSCRSPYENVRARPPVLLPNSSLLKELHLSGLPIPMQTLPSILRRFPILETLEIIHLVSEYPTHENPYDDDAVDLPNLRKIVYRTRTPAGVRLMKNISLRPGTLMDLEINVGNLILTDTDTVETKTWAVVDIVLPIFQVVTDHHARLVSLSVGMGGSTDKGAMIRGWEAPCLMYDRYRLPEPQFSMRINGGVSHGQESVLVMEFCSTPGLDLFNLRELEVREISWHTWENLAMSLPQLTTLRLFFGDQLTYRDIPYILSRSSHTSIATNVVPFPNLELLTIQQFDFRIPRAIQVLGDTLKARALQGVPVRKVKSFMGTGCTAKQIKELRAIVPDTKVEWDWQTAAGPPVERQGPAGPAHIIIGQNVIPVHHIQVVP